MVPARNSWVDCQHCNKVGRIKKQDLISSNLFSCSGYGFGSAIWIPLQTAFINPENIPPVSPQCLIGNSSVVDCSDDDFEKYFEDKELLERVPYCFLLVGGVAAGLCILGLILVKESPEQTTDTVSVELPSLSPGEVLRTKLFYQVIKILVFLIFKIIKLDLVRIFCHLHHTGGAEMFVF